MTLTLSCVLMSFCSISSARFFDEVDNNNNNNEILFQWIMGQIVKSNPSVSLSAHVAECYSVSFTATRLS